MDSELESCSAGVHDLGFSDHRGQIVELECMDRSTTIKTDNIAYRPLTQNGMNLFYSKVSEIQWNFVNENGPSVEEKFSKFIGLLEESWLQGIRGSQRIIDLFLCCQLFQKYLRSVCHSR